MGLMFSNVFVLLIYISHYLNVKDLCRQRKKKALRDWEGKSAIRLITFLPIAASEPACPQARSCKPDGITRILKRRHSLNRKFWKGLELRQGKQLLQFNPIQFIYMELIHNTSSQGALEQKSFQFNYTYIPIDLLIFWQSNVFKKVGQETGPPPQQLHMLLWCCKNTQCIVLDYIREKYPCISLSNENQLYNVSMGDWLW